MGVENRLESLELLNSSLFRAAARGGIGARFLRDLASKAPSQNFPASVCATVPAYRLGAERLAKTEP